MTIEKEETINTLKKKDYPKQAAHLARLNSNQDGENNRAWKGDNAGYKAKHWWVRHHLEKPEFCEKCNTNPPREVANLDGKYSRDLKTWAWLCRSCHLRMDNVAEKAWATKRSKL
jgi:hypothetical protein